MKRFGVILVLPLLLAGQCETRPDAPRADWKATAVDQARSARLAADPWLRPEQSEQAGSEADLHPGGGRPWLVRPEAKRWSEEPIPGDPYDALGDEIAAARDGGWFVTGAYCWSSTGSYDGNAGHSPETPDPLLEFSVDRIVVGFAKPADDLDHAEAAYLLEEFHEPGNTPLRVSQAKGTIMVSGVAPHHADQGWPKYVPVRLADTCLADLHHPRLPADGEDTPKTNPPPPRGRGQTPLDQAGNPFADWNDPARFTEQRPRKPVPSTPAAPST